MATTASKGFISLLFKGDPNGSGIVTQSAKQMMSTLLSRSEQECRFWCSYSWFDSTAFTLPQPLPSREGGSHLS
jgi:hypothetical protein